MARLECTPLGSIGVQSGDYGGKKSSAQPRASRPGECWRPCGRSDYRAPRPAPAAASARAAPRCTTRRCAIHRPLDQPGHVQAVGGERRHQRGVLARVARHAPVARRSGVPSRRVGSARCACRFRRQRRTPRDRPPGDASRHAARAASSRSLAASDFFSASSPRRCSARHMVASLSCCPWCSAHQAQCSKTVASGAAASRARRSASCSGPIARGRPGIGLRASEPVCAAAPRRA